MLGDMLRAERERQNLSIKDIEAGTSIRALYIECIENGDYSQLPGEVYTKGFIRNYASYLKLDADALVNQFVEENHPEQAASKAAQKQAAKDEKKAMPEKKQAKSSSAGKNVPAEKAEPGQKRRNMLLLGVVVLLVALGAFYLSGAGEKQEAQPTASQTQQAKAPDTEAPAAPIETPAAPKKAEGVEVAAKFSDSCWMQVEADGKTIYEGTLEKGKTQVWKAKETLVITAGNAGAIELKVNGKELGKAGGKGQVVEKTFTPEGEKSLAGKKDSKKE